MTIRAILLYIAICTLANGAATLETTTTNRENVCWSDECLDIAYKLSRTIDRRFDPCENFYDFVCGKFVEWIPVEKNFNYRNSLIREIYLDIQRLFNADIEPNEPKSFRLAKRLYKNCMNTAAIEDAGVEPLRDHLRKLGGWPVVEGDSWKGKNFDWRRTIKKFRHDGQAYLYHIGDGVGYLVHAVVDTDNYPKPSLITLKQPDGLLPNSANEADFDKKESILSIYYNSMVEMAQMLGADYNRAVSEIREILSFEIKLNQIKLQKSELEKLKRYNRFTIAKLKKAYPTVPWMRYIRKFVPFGIRVTNALIVNVPYPEYYVGLEALMADTPIRVQANYVMSRIALRNAVLSNEKMRMTVYRILAAIAGSPKRLKRSWYCAVEVLDHFWRVVAVMYADKFLDEETRATANSIVKNVEWQLNVKLLAYNWTDEAAWELASEKLAGLVTHLGYPNSVIDHSKLEELYDNLEFTKDDYFSNMDDLSNHDRKLGIRELKKPSSEIDEWTTLRHLFDIAAACYTDKNCINYRYWSVVSLHTATDASYSRIFAQVMGPEMLRGLIFDKARPKYMNYGAFGHWVGHEMIHAFFDPGCYRQRCGKYVSYFSLADRPEFDSRAKCLIDQYESYHVDDNGTKLDGKKTLLENIADVGGARLSYDAYESWAAVNPGEPKLPGFERYSAKQMFWISGAAMKCELITPERIHHLIRTDDHTINKFRVIGALSNIPEFAKDFNCKSTSLMNPAKRCDIWQSS